MDNNNNKQLFWQVKDFLGKKQEPKVNSKPSNLINTVKDVMAFGANANRPNIHEARNGIVNSSQNTKHAVSNVLNSHDQKCKLKNHHAKNILITSLVTCSI
jgi:hypothetical protein